MNIERMSAMANIAALIPAVYCAYGTWRLLHQQNAVTAEAIKSAPIGVTGIVVSLFLALALIIVAGALNLFAKRGVVPETPQAQTTPAQAVASVAIMPAPASPIDVKTFFHRSYSGQLQGETERNIRMMIQSQPQPEREDFVVRFIATGLLNVIYDRIWLTIFRSQLLALWDLNRKILRGEEVKQFYDAAVSVAPEFYATYPFENWFKYLKSQGLILEHPGNTIEITVLGKDFLKYIVHCGYTADDRKF